MVTKIFGCDSLTADINVPLAEGADYDKVRAYIAHLQEAHNTKPREKIYITAEEFKELDALARHLPTKGVYPGGSSGNTLTTVKRLLGNQVSVDFMSAVEDSPRGEIIREGMHKAGIRLHTPNESGVTPESAITYNFMDKEGRTACIYSGNIRDIVKPHMTEQHVRDNDVLLIQGAFWDKAGHDTPDTMMRERFAHNKEVWLALPTQGKFSDTMTQDKYRFLIPSADMVLGSEKELMRVYEVDNLNAAFTLLKSEMSRRNDIRRSEGKIHFEQEPVAFITAGGEGAYVVAPSLSNPIYVRAVGSQDKLENLLGAGDNAFAGFIAGRKAGLSLEESAELGMQLSGAKMESPAARLDDPAAALMAYTARSRELWKKARRMLESKGQSAWAAHAGDSPGASTAISGP